MSSREDAGGGGGGNSIGTGCIGGSVVICGGCPGGRWRCAMGGYCRLGMPGNGACGASGGKVQFSGLKE